MSVISTSRKVALLVAALLGAACSSADDEPTYTSTDVDVDASTEVARLQCESGAVQDCTIFLGRHGDLSNCVKGVDICSDGAWTGCIDEGTLSDNPALYAELVGE